MLSNFDLKLRQTLYVRLPFIVALWSSEEQKERTHSILSGGETTAGPIQENFKADPLGSRGDLNKSDRIGHQKYFKFRLEILIFSARGYNNGI